MGCFFIRSATTSVALRPNTDQATSYLQLALRGCRTRLRLTRINPKKKLVLEYIFPKLILFRFLICHNIGPAHSLVTSPARDITDDVSAGGHHTLDKLSCLNVDDIGDQYGLAVNSTEVLSAILMLVLPTP